MEDIPWGTDSQLTDNQFYNREEDLEFIKNLLNTTASGSPPTIMLSGTRGVGKTVFLKKVKKDMEEDYLISYVDLTQVYSYQLGRLDEISLMHHFYKSWIDACNKKNFSTLVNKMRKFAIKKFKIKDVADVGGYPLPIPHSEEDFDKLIDFVMNMPQEIYNSHSKDLKGVIMIIDEFQALNDLDNTSNNSNKSNRLDRFLWLFRSFIQNQKNVAYVFSGSVNSKDTIIEKIAGRSGAFGGRMLTLQINPFNKETVYNYLKERSPSLKLADSGFERFYSCTKGIPYYVNTFTKLLQKNVTLTDKNVIDEFQGGIPILADHFKQQWAGLNLSEQKILSYLVIKPIKREEIAKIMGRTSGSLSKILNKLQKADLIISENGLYFISQPLLKAWLKQEYEKRGVFPFRVV